MISVTSVKWEKQLDSKCTSAWYKRADSRVFRVSTQNRETQMPVAREMRSRWSQWKADDEDSEEEV